MKQNHFVGFIIATVGACAPTSGSRTSPLASRPSTSFSVTPDSSCSKLSHFALISTPASNTASRKTRCRSPRCTVHEIVRWNPAPGRTASNSGRCPTAGPLSKPRTDDRLHRGFQPHCYQHTRTIRRRAFGSTGPCETHHRGDPPSSCTAVSGPPLAFAAAQDLAHKTHKTVDARPRNASAIADTAGSNAKVGGFIAHG